MCFIKINGRDIHGLAFDPVTETIFFTDTKEKSINFISLKPGCINNVYGNLLIKVDDGTPADIGVDSCRGYIYWFHTITENTIWKWERARFNGSERKVLSTKNWYKKYRLVFDPQTQMVFNFEFDVTIVGWPGGLYRNDLNSGNEVKLVADNADKLHYLLKKLTISKDYIYWTKSSVSYESVWQFPKNGASSAKPIEIHKFYNERPLGITARYKIEDQIYGIQDCDSLSSLIPTITVTPDYTDERRGYDVCDNYCLQGNCSVNDEGLPKCSCNAGYSGKRCEVDACHGYCLNNGDCSLKENTALVCQCKGDYLGDRCELSGCLNYCLHGNCSLSDDGHPTCSCDAGCSGERCEVSACHGYCLNDGDCSLNEEDQPVCQCVGNYEGSRCEADIHDTTPTYELTKRNLTLVDLLSTWRKPASKMFVLVEV